MSAESQSATKPSNYRWLVFGLLSLGYLLVYFHRLCPAVVAVELMDDLHAGGGLIGLLASAYFYPYALMQIPSGLLSDSWGPRKTITTFFLLAGVASIAFGLAPTAPMAIIARVFVGLGVCMLFVPTMKILTNWFRVSEFAFMTGLLMTIGGAGALSAATPLAFMSNLIGWRGSFIAIGVVTLVLAVCIWIWVRNDPRELGFESIRDTENQKSGNAQTYTLWEGVKLVLFARRFWPLAAWFFFTFAIFFSFSGLWGGPYLMHVYGLTKSEAGKILSMLALSMVVTSPLFSPVSNRLKSRKKVLMVSSLILCLLMIPLAFFTDDLSIPLLHLWSLLFGIFGSAVVVIGFACAKELFPVEIAGTSVGLINLSPFLAGAIAQPVLGLVLDRWGQGTDGYPPDAYAAAFTIYFVSSILAFISTFFLKETFPKSPK